MTQPAANDVGAVPSAGARLAQARERLGMSQEQVADKLKLDAHTVVALEAGDYRVIGAAVFVRGFLQRYAQLVGESPTEIAALYARQPEASLAPDLARIAIHADRSHRAYRAVRLWPFAVGVLLLCAAGAWWWSSHRHAPAAGDFNTEVVELPAAVAPTAPLTAQPITASVASTATAPPGAAVPPVAVPALDAQAAALAARLAALPRRHLTLRVNDESWAEVYDARGMRLQFGFAHAGSTKELIGAPPFRLVLGNATAVEVLLEGAAISLPAATPGARLRVTLSGKGVVTLRP
jgi:cytoskeleton protein RodZ